MFRIAVCDDEGYFRNRIMDIVSVYMQTKGYVYDVSCFESGESFLESDFRQGDYHIVFLDVNMKEMDGVETAKAIRRLMPNTYIVFVTAYISYALEGYKVNAIRYILKEDGNLKRAIQECLDTVIDKMNDKKISCSFMFLNGKRELVVDRILYVESRLHKVFFFVVDEGITSYTMYDKLDHVEEKLNPFGFCRIHQSFLVNMRYIRNMERYKVILINGMELNISKKYYKDVEARYVKSKGEI